MTAALEDRFREGAYRGEHGARRYRLYVPDSPGPDSPLLVMLHGCTQDAVDFAAGTRMNALAEEEGFLVLYPEQPVEAHPKRCWRWYEPEHQSRGRGEPAILAGLVREVAGAHEVSRGRIHLAGISAGAAMALVVASAYPELFGSVASHSGIPYAAARSVEDGLAVMTGGGPAAEVLARRLQEARRTANASLPPLVVFQGTADEAVHPANAGRTVKAWLHAARGEAPPEPDERREGETPDGRAWVCLVWRARDGKPRVEQWTVRGLGHAWSGGSDAGSYADPRGPDASREILRFVKEVTAS